LIQIGIGGTGGIHSGDPHNIWYGFAESFEDEPVFPEGDCVALSAKATVLFTSVPVKLKPKDFAKRSGISQYSVSLHNEYQRYHMYFTKSGKT
jgi:hypothetical protein